MRMDNSPMTPEEFEHAVKLAQQGAISSCNGATDEITAALNAIIDAYPQDQPEAVRKAHKVYQDYLSGLE